MLIDAHAHLSDERFKECAEEIASKTENSEPKIIVDTGADRATSEDCFLRAQKYKGIYCAVGVHPEYADKLTDEDVDRFKEMWEDVKCAAIGEIGLDYHYENNPDRETQKRAMIRQMRLAYEIGAPVVLHIRDAHGDAVKLLNENKELIKNGLLVHCYSGSKELVKEYAKLGAYFSYGGAVTFANAKDKPDIVRATPIDRIILETDCPYMSPEPMRGKRNEPSFIRFTARKIGEIIGKTEKETEDIIQANTLRLFKKIKI